MRYYELTYLIPPEVSEEELRSLEEKINSVIQTEGGILSNQENYGKKELVSKIKKKNVATLIGIDFYLKPEKIENLKKEIINDKKILKFLISTKKQVKKVEIPRPRIKKEKVGLEEIEKKLKEILNESQ